jgi:hypothetical protein
MVTPAECRISAMQDGDAPGIACVTYPCGRGSHGSRGARTEFWLPVDGVDADRCHRPRLIVS